MQEIYYVDRPSVPAERQNIIHLDAILEHAVFIDAEDINDSYSAHAVEVRNSEGEIDGTLLYFPGVTHDQLTRSRISEDLMIDELEVEDAVDEEVIDEDSVEDVTSEPITVHEFNNESTLIDLEIELAGAKRVVQDIEEDIAAIEKGSFID